MLHRVRLDRNRHDYRDETDARRARTRTLIELGGLVRKAGLANLVFDDRATLLGALLEAAEAAANSINRARWQSKGLHAFKQDREGDDAEDSL